MKTGLFYKPLKNLPQKTDLSYPVMQGSVLEELLWL